MAYNKILDALKQLDPGKDNQWTSTKQPSVAAVSELHGETVSRADIDAAAEGFNRDTAVGFFMDTGGSKQADGTETTAGASMDADGKEQVPGGSRQADGSLAPAPDTPKPDANAPGSEASSTAQSPPAVDALTDDLDPADGVVKDVGSQRPWETSSTSGFNRPVPIGSPEGQETIADTRPVADERTGAGALLTEAVADELPGQNADGEISGVRKPAVTYEPLNRDDVVTSGPDGDAVDADGLPSGVPSPISVGDFSLHPPPLNPAEISQAPVGDEDSSRDDGAADTAGATGGPANGHGETEQRKVDEAAARADEIASMEKDLRAKEDDVAALRVKASDVNKEMREAEAEADKVRQRIEDAKPTNSNQVTLQAFLESENKRRVEVGEQRAALVASGIDLKDLASKLGASPIDASMARRNDRGTRRPVRT